AAEWRRNYGAVVKACNGIETMAFAYLISGEKKYAQRVREWLLHIASWDPAGSTSIKVNDEAGMPILHITSRAYDWIHDALSDDDRRVLRDMIRARGEEAYRRLHGRPYEQRAYDSHGGRMWHFLGEAAIAYHDEIEEADRWLEYAIAIFWGWYPIWSDSDGGWSEGIAYWNSYINRVTWWLDALNVATGIDGTRKPFFSKVGDFPLYCAAPRSPISGFGDYGERGAPSSAGRVVNYFADAVGNPYWKWYAEAWGAAEHEDTPIGFLRAARPPAEAKSPDDLPTARLFRGTGWVAMHTDLANPDDDVQLMFRSSAMGNISHAHADQNAIVLAAYGEPLLVNTGIRPWYGSEFCRQYYWATLSHNCILVNGEGQSRSANAVGNITAFRHDGRFTYTSGDAGAAYDNAREVARRIMFVRPDVFVIHDRVVADEPVAVQWLAHGRSPFEISERDNTVLLRHGNARARISFVAPAKVRFTQTDRYPLEPETGKTVPEWHLTVETAEPARTADFITVIAVAREGEPSAVVEVEALPGRCPGVRLHRGDEIVTVAFADREGALRLDQKDFPGEAAAVIRGADGSVRGQFAARQEPYLARGKTESTTPGRETAMTLRAAMCQILCLDGDKSGNYARIERALARAREQRADIACFPEMSLLGWVNPEAHKRGHAIPGEDTERLGALAREYGLMLAIGLAEKDGDKLYDAAALIDSDGTLLLKHRKINTLDWLMEPPYSKGIIEDIAAVETRLGRIGMLICADTFREDILGAMRRCRPQLVIVPYGWAEREEAWPQHHQRLHDTVAAAATAIGAPVVGVDLVGQIAHGPWTGRTYGGAGVAVDEAGAILAVGADRDVDTVLVEIALPPRFGS
ncbi:MAG: DUF4962 domain-containing protein, partial [Armatimonadota bacterium]